MEEFNKNFKEYREREVAKELNKIIEKNNGHIFDGEMINSGLLYENIEYISNHVIQKDNNLLALSPCNRYAKFTKILNDEENKDMKFVYQVKRGRQQSNLLSFFRIHPLGSINYHNDFNFWYFKDMKGQKSVFKDENKLKIKGEIITANDYMRSESSAKYYKSISNFYNIEGKKYNKNFSEFSKNFLISPDGCNDKLFMKQYEFTDALFSTVNRDRHRY
jgi:hypothetical protein